VTFDFYSYVVFHKIVGNVIRFSVLWHYTNFSPVAVKSLLIFFVWGLLKVIDDIVF
jgi:hypothetical protein